MLMNARKVNDEIRLISTMTDLDIWVSVRRDGSEGLSASEPYSVAQYSGASENCGRFASM